MRFHFSGFVIGAILGCMIGTSFCELTLAAAGKQPGPLGRAVYHFLAPRMEESK